MLAAGLLLEIGAISSPVRLHFLKQKEKMWKKISINDITEQPRKSPKMPPVLDKKSEKP